MQTTIAKVAVIMGSQSDWETMKEAVEMLEMLEVAVYCEIISAHRTPEKLLDFAKNAVSNGFEVIIAGAGGAAHLPGMVAASTVLPVFGVPVQTRALNGLDSLLSIVQMPRGVAVGTLAIGAAGAYNAGLLAAQVLARQDADLAKRIEDFRNAQTERVSQAADPRANAAS